MRGTLVPVLISLATGNNQSIAHIERDDQFSTSRGSHSTLAHHLHREVDVVVGGVDLLNDVGLFTATLADCLHHQLVYDLMVVLCICLGHYHVCDITLHSFTNQISIGHSLLIHRLVLPVLPHLLSEITTATVNGKSIISFWSYTYFNKVVSTSYGSNAVIEHVFRLLNALHKGRNTFLRNIHHAYHLWPLLASLLKPCLQMLVKF